MLDYWKNNVKPDSHTSLEKQFARRRANGRVKELEISEGGGVKHYFAWDSNLWLCESAPDVDVNYLLYEQTDKKGKVTRWTYMTGTPRSGWRQRVSTASGSA
jgi:hypothetical protein